MVFQILVQVKEVLSKLPSLIEITLKEVSNLQLLHGDSYFSRNHFKSTSCLSFLKLYFSFYIDRKNNNLWRHPWTVL